MHGAIPVQPPPDQPVNVPAIGFAVRVNCLPFMTVTLQPFPSPSQLMPLGIEVTVPLPSPMLAT